MYVLGRLGDKGHLAEGEEHATFDMEDEPPDELT